MPEETRPGIDETQKGRPQHGPAGDARPNPDGADPRARPGQKPEKVEDRPTVSQVKPEDYPDKASGKDLL
ncbi:hypothetical protein HZF05_10125 [Sphingomonas sp. CGMCC 1.13654]|uniref:Uncharacterized protein n=1 Tax=Sphingomonas chungangi TaxID=2683589 RepID=A0A838L4M2_9SPHN|nr:hypothetical protein [Sphingomonas chungangi]MBA2934453.1 hypothetical protein [Sphingomonas chungangi]